MLHNHVDIALHLLQKLDESYFSMLSKLDNVHRALSAVSQPVTTDLKLSCVNSSCEDKEDSDLPRPVKYTLVSTDLGTEIDKLIKASSAIPECQVFDKLSQRVEKIFSELSLLDDDFENNKNRESETKIYGNSNLVIDDYGHPLAINDGEGSVITNGDEENLQTDETQEFDSYSQGAGQTFHDFSIVADDIEIIGPILSKALESRSEVCRNTNLVLGASGLFLKISYGKGTILTYGDGENSGLDAGKLFGICPQKAGLFLVANDVVVSFSELIDPLILDGIRLHTHISIHFPFDPGVPVPPPILFESLNLFLDNFRCMSIVIYSGIFTLYGAIEVFIFVLHLGREVANLLRVCSGDSRDNVSIKMLPSMASYESSSKRWFLKNKESVLTRVATRLGLILLYVIAYGLASIDKYLHRIDFILIFAFPLAPWSQYVEYAFRFDDVHFGQTTIKYMANKLPLMEALLDPYLSKYSVIFVTRGRSELSSWMLCLAC